jgi:DNA-binding response OmpR family regulator
LDRAVLINDVLNTNTTFTEWQALRTWKKAPHIVVTTRIGEWKDYLEALQLGASDMIQYPYRSTDVELNVLRAMRRGDPESDRATA